MVLLINFSLINFILISSLASSAPNDDGEAIELKYNYSTIPCPEPSLKIDLDFIQKGSPINAICYFSCSQPELVELRWISFDYYQTTPDPKPWILKASREGTKDHHIHISFTPESDGYIKCIVHDSNCRIKSVEKLVSLYHHPNYVPMNLSSVSNQSNVALLWTYRLPEYDVYEESFIDYWCIVSPYYCNDAEPLTTRSYHDIDNDTHVKITKIKCTIQCAGVEKYSFEKLIYMKSMQSLRKKLSIESNREHNVIVEKYSGENVTFYCNFSGPFIPELFWIKDFGIMDRNYGNRISIRESSNESKLIMSNLTVDDSGLYSFNVSNTVQDDCISSRVRVFKEHAQGSDGSKVNMAYFQITIFSILLFFLLVSIIVKQLIRNRKLKMMWKQFQQLESVLRGDLDDPALFVEHRELESIFRKKYDTKLEINPSEIAQGGIIGKGNFGQVIRGLYNHKLVAIKTPRDFFNISQYKSLIGELKILSYVGSHPNIVNLIGACTTGLGKGELCLIVDLCELGNLKDFLIKSKPTFNPQSQYSQHTHKDDNDGTISTFCTIDLSLNTIDLIRFCHQICSGMKFISSKAVSIYINHMFLMYEKMKNIPKY